MVMVGGRHPVKAHYSVGFKSDGKITALHLDLLINAGISEDASPQIPGTVISSVKKYNWGALSFDIKLCKTNNTSKSVMRAPGDSQGSLIADTIIEHVASMLLKPVMDRLQLQSGNVSWDALISQVEIDLLTGAITLLRGDLVYDCGKSLNPAVDLGQIEGSFIQGIGFFIYEEYLTNKDGLMISNSTWDYKIPSVDTIPKQFNAEVLNTGYHKHRVLSSKASGEPALVLASSVHCAVREAIRAARKEFPNSTGNKNSRLVFQLDVPAPMTAVKELCGLDIVEKYLESIST
ncbi:hypothetical protein PR202_ga30541 [Eleusine coracana subsp. coracana]|uniref:Aldehyde oxidase/xanthine dehydrogenase second molybdopterin binding domain-containing protein n=1 Tax=Eleusine coracana subsp. coracana TaxID=191504 RepID=A0AAV5DQ14_ELECO|nr:hypothetical protein PR202_ga30507 [Eleusine coracana subsp. coracana]GJN12276.1 hypothetical protein PR202_ga30541 [Eleusine coracana subsp. coracana]